MDSRVVCGLKLTHDGSVAVIEGGRLRFCVEAEKLGNRPRYSELSQLELVDEALAAEGMTLADADVLAVDGWVRFGDGAPVVEVFRGGVAAELPVAGYDERRDARAAGSVLHHVAGELPGPRAPLGYRSYAHATGHVFAAYGTSPFAAAGQPSLVLVWDGGMPACLYLVDPGAGSASALGTVLDVNGSVYPIFAAQLAPFALPADSGPDAYLPISGKAMAFAGLGGVDEDAVGLCDSLLTAMGGTLRRRAAAEFSMKAVADLHARGRADPDIIASFQEFLLRRLLRGFRDILARVPVAAGLPLCVSGGCALNIKWNAGLRASGLFADVWVPPFPNDSGSAIGTACAALFGPGGTAALDWSVFSGPGLGPAGGPTAGWPAAPLTVAGLAALLHQTQEPVVVLTGRAELGPRALGHRSILASARSADMRHTLNRAKQREPYRPVAPVCLAEHAAEVFEPGSPDRYMLFDHAVRPGWVDRIPAVVHADGSARLQTVGRAGDPFLRELLEAYYGLTGVPVLCNTSANFPGRGFFPDVASALEWGMTRFVWSEGTLYTRAG